MPALPLRTRRNLARGISRRAVRYIGGRTRLGDGNRSQLKLGTGNAAVLFINRALGTSVAPTVRYVAAGTASQPTTASVAGVAVTVTLGTNASTVINATANDVVRAVNFANAAGAAGTLVWAQLAPGSDGTGTVSAVAATALTGSAATPAY